MHHLMQRTAQQRMRRPDDLDLLDPRIQRRIEERIKYIFP